MIKNIFDAAVCQEIVDRIERLTPESPAQWGKMNVAQMLAHCNVSYEMVYEDIHPKPNFLIKLLLKLMVKKIVVNDQPYKHNLGTAPAFKVSSVQDFEKEKGRLIAYILRTQALGEAEFDGKESHSFGVLNKTEWNHLFYKHLDHHLAQFGV